MGYGTYCFPVEAFAKENFDVGAFLEECRTRNPMETIHQDLKAFQTALENQLVAIINEDYTEFLQLSSKLKGVDEAVSSVRLPISKILQRVDQTQQAILQLQSKIQQQLQTFDNLRKKESDLELSIRISEKLLLLEDLLEISTPIDSDEEQEPVDLDEDEDEDDGFNNFGVIKKANSETSAAEGCAKLERATRNLLQLELEFFEGVDIPTIQREEKRLAVIEETLLRRLETEFATEIFPDTFYNRDHAISAVTLSYLLRSYMLLQKSHIPEEMIGRLLVLPFAEETITRGKLDGRVRGSCEGLPQIYEAIVEFIRNKFIDILALAVCQGETKCSVDILGNSIWKPLQEILVSKHSIIFQAADPDRFHRNYTLSMQFLAEMEKLCGNETTKMRFRSHESVVEFKEKWNMDVYFQLRYKQMASSLEQAFGKKREENNADMNTGETAFHYESSKVLWKVMQNCWSEDIFLLPLLANFNKLCLQLLVYYVGVWKSLLLNTIGQLKSGAKIDFTSVPVHFLRTEEDLLWAGSDFHTLRQRISSELLLIVEKHVEPFVDDAHSFASDLFKETLTDLAKLEDTCWSVAVIMVADECKKVLPALRTVKGQYQMTNKPPPTVSSSYVSNIISPLGEFLTKWGEHFDSNKKQELLQSIMDSVCELYFSLSTELLKSAMELEESLKSRKLQRNASSALTTSTALSDTEKMRMQLLLDLQEMQRQVSAMDFDLEKCPAFQEALASLSSSTIS